MAEPGSGQRQQPESLPGLPRGCWGPLGQSSAALPQDISSKLMGCGAAETGTRTLCDTSVAGSSFTCYTTAPALKFYFYKFLPKDMCQMSKDKECSPQRKRCDTKHSDIPHGRQFVSQLLHSPSGSLLMVWEELSVWAPARAPTWELQLKLLASTWSTLATAAIWEWTNA